MRRSASSDIGGGGEEHLHHRSQRRRAGDRGSPGASSPPRLLLSSRGPLLCAAASPPPSRLSVTETKTEPNRDDTQRPSLTSAIMMSMNSKQPFSMHPILHEPKYTPLHSSSEAIRRACLPTPSVSPDPEPRSRSSGQRSHLSRSRN